MNKICIELMNGKKMNLQLYPDVAPITVKNFLDLVDNKFFDGLVFHRVIKDFMCQGGGYFIKDHQFIDRRESKPIKGEFASNGIPNNIKHTLGVISMARTNVKDSASSQFFLCVDHCQHLDGEYAAFGKMIDDESIKVLKELNSYPTAMVDSSLADWPNVEEEKYTIKSIYRID